MTGRTLVLLACPLLAILLYLPTLGHDFVFDDRAVIAQNPLMSTPGSLVRIVASPYWPDREHGRSLYRPLTSVSFSLNRVAAGGLYPLAFHLVNILLHGAATFLVTLLAFEALPGLRGPLVAGALFAVHPVHVEAVAGIVGRSEILAACGVLGAVLAHRVAQRASGHAGALWMGAAWAASFLGMLAKESATVAVVLCGLTDRAFPTAGPAGRRRLIGLYAGHAAILGLYLLVRARVLGGLGTGEPIPFVDNPAASAGPLAGRLTALGAVARYAVLLLWPRRLSADYSYDQIPVVGSFANPLVAAGLLLVLAAAGGGAWLLRRAPVWGYGLLWVAVSASLTTNLIFFIGTLLAERLMYLPSAGLCLLAGCAAVAAGAGRRGALATAGLVLAVAAGAARTLHRLPEWKDDFALYESAARVSPRSTRIRYNLGNAFLRRGEYTPAEENYRAALAIYPEFLDARVNLGMALLQQGRPREALGLLESAVASKPRDPDLLVNLGAAHRALGDDGRAADEFRKALDLDPESARAWNNLGSVKLRAGDVAGAIVDLETAVRLAPDLAVFHLNLADALTAAAREREAAEHFEAAARIDPGLPEAHRGLGEVALRRGDLSGAEREFRLAAAAREPSARACNFLGYLLQRRGEHRAAAEQYERSVALDPGLADAHRSLGLLYAGALGDPARGARHLAESLRIDPGQPGGDDLRALLRRLERIRAPAPGTGP